MHVCLRKFTLGSQQPYILFQLFDTGVIDTDGKFAAGVVDTSGKFATSAVDIGGAP